jgi:hypothetical protein
MAEQRTGNTLRSPQATVRFISLLSRIVAFQVLDQSLNDAHRRRVLSFTDPGNRPLSDCLLRQQPSLVEIRSGRLQVKPMLSRATDQAPISQSGEYVVHLCDLGEGSERFHNLVVTGGTPHMDGVEGLPFETRQAIRTLTLINPSREKLVGPLEPVPDRELLLLFAHWFEVPLPPNVSDSGAAEEPAQW